MAQKLASASHCSNTLIWLTLDQEVETQHWRTGRGNECSQDAPFNDLKGIEKDLADALFLQCSILVLGFVEELILI